MRLSFCFLFFLAFTAARAEERLSAQRFLHRVGKGFEEKAPQYSRFKLKVGETAFVDVSWLRPGQATFSYYTILGKINNTAEEFGLKWNGKSATWQLPFDSARAVFPLKKAALGVLLKDGIVLADGNHKLLTSLYYGAETLPVRILADWRKYTLQEAFLDLVDANFIFPYSRSGERLHRLPTFAQLEDEPFRYLAQKLLLKCQVEESKEGELRITDTRGSRTPVVCKLNRDVPFLELRMALALRMGGLQYSPRIGVEPSRGVVEKAREILLAARQSGKAVFKSLKSSLFVEEPISIHKPRHLSDEEMEMVLQLISEHLSDHKICESVLGDSYF